MGEAGYAGEILKIDLTRRSATRENTSDYAAKYIGGRGLAARLYWDMVPAGAGSLSPENCMIFTTGPTTGFSGIAGCRWQICARSPIHDPEAFSYGNLGGRWGTSLKAAGFDAVTVQGKADCPVYIYIHDGEFEIRDATAFRGLSTFDTQDSIRASLGQDVSVATTGPAGENGVVFATVLADEGASAGAGLGAVMGAKNLKAIAVSGNRPIKAAHPERLRNIVEHIKKLREGRPDRPSPWSVAGVTFRDDCYGCSLGCNRQMYLAEKGRRYKSFCQQTTIYAKAANSYFNQIKDNSGELGEVKLRALRLCDAYSLDSSAMEPVISWLIDCYREGLITEKETGLPLSKAGGPEFIEVLTRLIAYSNGFGDILARGLLPASRSIGTQSVEVMYRHVSTRSSEARDYDPRLFITTALLYATEPRRPINQLHGVSIAVMAWASWLRKAPGSFLTTDDIREVGRRFWGGEIAADFSTYEGKARAAKMIQDRCHAKDSLILCDLIWPMMSVSPLEHVGDPSLECQIYSAVTGRETSMEELLKMGERIANLQRAIHIRQGWRGRKDDVILDYYHDKPLKEGDNFVSPDGSMPGPQGKVISRLGCVVEREKFEQMKTEYYKLRGWDVDSGYPTLSRLKELGLEDAAGFKGKN
jgi:aldehyde:ferredoxin oxidoreductase